MLSIAAYLEKLVKAAKVVHAAVEIVDIPGLTKGSSKGEGVGSSFLSDIRQTDAIIHVIRCFDDENLPHIEGKLFFSLIVKYADR